MNKYSVVFTILILFVFITACADEKLIQVTVNPSAQPLLNTLAVIATTVESIGQSATAYAATLTPSNTPPPPTQTPNEDEVKKLLSEAIKDELITTLGAKITVADVKFGPIGAQELTELYIEINCESESATVCPLTQAITAVFDACKQKKKAREYVPSTTKVLIMTIFDPRNSPKIVEVDWPNVLAYVNGDIPAAVFSQLIRYTQ